MSGGSLLVFELYPELKALGRERLLELCDAWISAPIAREAAVSMLLVGADGEVMTLDLGFTMTHQVHDGEEFMFPMDALLHFIVDRAIDSPADREQLKRDIARDRARDPDTFRRFRLNLGPKLLLNVVCKHPPCQSVIGTGLSAYKSQSLSWGPAELACPVCGESARYDQTDLFFLLWES